MAAAISASLAAELCAAGREAADAVVAGAFFFGSVAGANLELTLLLPLVANTRNARKMNTKPMPRT